MPLWATGRPRSRAAVSLLIPPLSRSASVPARAFSSGVFFRSWLNRSSRAMSTCFFSGRNSSPRSWARAVLALIIMVFTAWGVPAWMMNSRSMLPVYFSGSFMASSARVYSPMFWVIFAPPSMAHWPNRVLSAAIRRSPGRFWMA